MEFITVLYLIFMFIALYFFSFFILLTIKNRKKLFLTPKPNTNYFISVLIQAYNEEDSIPGTLEHVCNFDYPKDKFEIIVINDGSKDRTVEIVKEFMKKYSNVKLIDKENSGKANSLNVGLKQARGELVAVVDSDSFPSKESLKLLTGYFDDSEMSAVTSFVTVRNKDQNFFAKIQSLEYLLLGWSRKLLDFVDSVYVTNGPLSVYRKSYAIKVGGFDPKSITEDIDITWNLLYNGYKTGMCLNARVSTVVPPSYKKWFKQRTRWGLGGLQALSKYRKMFLRKGMFGIFILPYVSFSIVISLATFIFSLYLIVSNILVKSLTTGYSLSTDSAVFTFSDINLYPSVILFYFIVLFTLSITYSYYVLKTTDYENNLTTRKFLTLLFYIFIYLTLYPLVWFASIYRFIIKDYRW